MQKHTSIIIGIVIIVAVLVGVFSVAWYALFSFEGDDAQMLQSQTSDWKTFHYQQYQFNYPSTWSTWMTFQSQVPGNCFVQGDSVCTYSGSLAFSVNILSSDKNTCQRYWGGVGGPGIPLVENRRINDKQFLYGKFNDSNLEVYHIFFNNSCYEIAKTISDDKDLNKILSTFTFTK